MPTCISKLNNLSAITYLLYEMFQKILLRTRKTLHCVGLATKLFRTFELYSKLVAGK